MKAFCLSLDKRKQYWTELQQQAQTVGMDLTPFIVGEGTILGHYDYVDDVNPDISRWGYGHQHLKKHHYNAFIAHQKIVEIAKEQKLKCFLMLEDDAYFTNRFSSVYKELLKRYSVLDFDVLYLGWWIGEETDEWNLKIEQEFNINRTVGLLKVSRLGGLHGAIINESMYDYILALKPVNPIDSQLNLIHNQIKSYAMLPKIIHTRSLYSNCDGFFVKRKYL